MAQNNAIDNRTSTLTVDNGFVVTTGTTTINSGTSALGISTDASNTTISFGTGGAAKLVTLGSTNGASSLTEHVGTGNYVLDGVAGSTYTLGASTTTGTWVIGGTAQSGAHTFGSSSTTNIVNLGTGEGATTANIASGTTNAKTINIGTGAAMANTIAIGGTGVNAITMGSAGTGATTVGNLTGTTTINFGGGNALTAYKTGTFTPTLDGSVSGTTTYTTQLGYYIKIGNLVWVNIIISISAATGTGDATLGALPFTVSASSSNSAKGSITCSGAWVWPTAATMLTANALSNTTTAVVSGNGSTISTARLQMTNASFSIQATILYSV